MIDKSNAGKTLITHLGHGADGEVIAYNPNDNSFYHWSGNGTVVFERVLAQTPYTVTPIFTGSGVGGEIFGAVWDPARGVFLVHNISSYMSSWTTVGVRSDIQAPTSADVRSNGRGGGHSHSVGMGDCHSVGDNGCSGCCFTAAGHSAAIEEGGNALAWNPCRAFHQSFMKPRYAVSPLKNREIATSQSGITYFPQSLASGDPRPESMVLWTRIEDAATDDRDLTLRLQVATDTVLHDL